MPNILNYTQAYSPVQYEFVEPNNAQIRSLIENGFEGSWEIWQKQDDLFKVRQYLGETLWYDHKGNLETFTKPQWVEVVFVPPAFTMEGMFEFYVLVKASWTVTAAVPAISDVITNHSEFFWQTLRLGAVTLEPRIGYVRRNRWDLGEDGLIHVSEDEPSEEVGDE